MKSVRNSSACVQVDDILPDDYKRIFDLVDVEDTVVQPRRFFRGTVHPKDYEKLRSAVLELLENPQLLEGFLKKQLTKVQLLHVYRDLLKKGEIPEPSPILDSILRKKAPRSNSGVVVVTVFTSPGEFSCPMDCHYCPNFPTMPRSYDPDEPGCRRALQDRFNPVLQMYDRLRSLEVTGHIDPLQEIPGKLEIIVSGGTFNFYPADYLEYFMTSLYFAANTYYDVKDLPRIERKMLSMEEEQYINTKSARLRIIGLTVETRPDYLANVSNGEYDLSVLQTFRRYGITRIQIGVQHTDASILKKVNRKCTPDENKFGIKLLKQNGFKVDIHLMLDLPGSSPEKDTEMLNTILDDPDYQADQWKLYPTEVLNYTKIKEWYEAGLYQPYGEAEKGALLRQVIKSVQQRIHPWIRINRVIRDFPHSSILGGVKCGSLRDAIDKEMRQEGIRCRCIRCREVKDRSTGNEEITLVIREFPASDGKEVFLSFEDTEKDIIHAFLRLRFNQSNQAVLPVLQSCALVRELHVYGKHVAVRGGTSGHSAQHRGLGKALLQKAEEISLAEGYHKVAIIAGVGVRDYYAKQGYELEETYMTKTLQNKILSSTTHGFVLGLVVICLSIILAIYFDYKY
jgi:ELP3 family radical SAM enzyme/protein acetyltransferase